MIFPINEGFSWEHHLEMKVNGTSSINFVLLTLELCTVRIFHDPLRFGFWMVIHFNQSMDQRQGPRLWPPEVHPEQFVAGDGRGAQSQGFFHGISR